MTPQLRLHSSVGGARNRRTKSLQNLQHNVATPVTGLQMPPITENLPTTAIKTAKRKSNALFLCRHLLLPFLPLSPLPLLLGRCRTQPPFFLRQYGGSAKTPPHDTMFPGACLHFPPLASVPLAATVRLSNRRSAGGDGQEKPNGVSPLPNAGNTSSLLVSMTSEHELTATSTGGKRISVFIYLFSIRVPTVFCRRTKVAAHTGRCALSNEMNACSTTSRVMISAQKETPLRYDIVAVRVEELKPLDS